MDKVSAIITTHNRCDLLKKAIDSVLNQSYENIECIVVDDASTDLTQEVMKQYEKRGVKYIRILPEESRGGNYARNLGWKNSTGKYIAYLDDDDQWISNKTALQVKYLEENIDVGFVTSGRIVDKDNGRYYYKSRLIENVKCDFSRKILYNIIGVTSTMMFKKEILEKVGGFDENLKFWQEYELTIRLCQEEKAGFLNKCLTIYKVNKKDKNRLTNKLNEWEDAVKYINEKHKILINNLSDEEKKLRELLICRDAILRCVNSNRKKEAKSYLFKIYRLTGEKKDKIKYIFNIRFNPYKELKSRLKWRLNNNLYKMIEEENK